MPLPVFQKTWTITPNDITATSGVAATDAKNATLKLKNKLLGLGFTTGYSCSSTVAGTVNDGVDRWATTANLVWNSTTGVRSWYVFKNTTIGSNFQVLIKCYSTTNASVYYLGIEVSPSAGFTGGSTTTNPTATDAITLTQGTTGESGWWSGPWSVAAGFTFHTWVSTDGEHVRIVICTSANTKPMGLIMFGKLYNPPDGHATPAFYASAYSSWTETNGYLRYADLYEAANVHGYNGGGYLMHLGAHESYVDGAIGERQVAVNDLTGYWPISPCVLIAPSLLLLSNQSGVMGEIPDLWWASTGLTVEGTTFDTATRQMVLWNNLIFPWDGVTNPHNGSAEVTTTADVDPTLPISPAGNRFVPISDDL